jgi:hypothetical protein
MYIMAKSSARKSKKLRLKTIRGGGMFDWLTGKTTGTTSGTTTGTTTQETKPKSSSWSSFFGLGKSEVPATTNISNPMVQDKVEEVEHKEEVPKAEAATAPAVSEPKHLGGKRRKRSKTSKK